MKVFVTLLGCFFSAALTAQLFVVDSLYGDNGVKLLSNYGYAYVPEVSVFADGDIYVRARNHRIVFIFGIMEVIRSGFQRLDACGNIHPDYGVTGYWNLDGAPIYLEKSLMLEDKTLYAAGGRNVNLLSTPCLQKVDSVGNLIIEFESPSAAYFTNPGATLNWRYLDFYRDTVLHKVTCVGSYLYGTESGIFMSVFHEDGTRDAGSFADGTRVIPIHSNESYLVNRQFKRSVQVDSNRFLLSASASDGDSLILAMVNGDGTLDATFGENGLVYDASVALNDGYNSILTTEKRLYQTEVIGDHLFVSTLEAEGDSFCCYLRKFAFDGVLDSTFGDNGKMLCFTVGDSELNAFIMGKIGTDRLMLSALKNGEMPTEETLFWVFDEMGIVVADFPVEGDGLEYATEKLMVDRVYFDNPETAYVLGSTYSGKLVLQKFRNENVRPHLTLNGTELNSMVTATGVYFEWMYNGTLIEGANQAVLEVNSPGMYSVTVRGGVGCSATYADTLQVEFVGTQTVISPEIQLSPNPCQSALTVYVQTLTSPMMVIYDGWGRLVYADRMTTNVKTVDVSGFSNGLYFIKCGETMKRFVVLKE